MRWADDDLATRPEQPSPEAEHVTDEEAAIEAELAEAMARSEAMADAPPKPPAEIQIYADATPNPNAMKFTASVTIMESGSLSVNSKPEADSNPLAKRLFEIAGVDAIFVVNDFCTVTKTFDASWSELIGPIETILMDELRG